MPDTNAVTYRYIHPWQVTIGTEVFAPELISSDGFTITLTPDTTEVKSMSGTIKVPNGSYSEASARVSILINDIETLKALFPNLTKAATYQGGVGQVVFGANACSSVDPVPIVFHDPCEQGSKSDICIPRALITQGGKFAFKQGDPTSLDLDITPLNSPEGMIIFGDGALDKATMWNPTSQAYEAVTQSKSTN